MIWNSIGIMSAIDVLIVSVVVAALYIFFKHQKPLADLRAAGGPLTVAFGLGVTGVFYAADLFTMLILPGFMPRADAMSLMTELHLNFRWILTIAATVTISLGFLLVVRKMRGDADQLEQSLAALRESEERRRLFMDSATEHFVLYDADLNLIDLNGTSLKALGCKKEDVIGRNLVDIFPAVVTTGRLETYREVLETGKPRELEAAIVFGDGRHGQIAMRIFKAGDGLGVSSANLTERKKAEAALFESEERRRLFMDSATEQFLLFDADLKLIDLNAIALESLGWKKEDVIGRNVTDLFRDAAASGRDDSALEAGCSRDAAIGRHLLEIAPQLATTDRYAGYLRVIETGAPYEAEAIMVSKTGEKRFKSVNAFPAGDGVGLVIRDITQQKQSEAALRRSDETLRTVVDNAPILLWAVDSKRVNTVLMGRWLNTVGIDPKERLGRREQHLSSPEIEGYLDAALRGEDQTYSITVNGRDLETRLVPLRDAGGAVEGAIGVSIDVTERNRAERDLAAMNQHLEDLVVERTQELRAAQKDLINAERLAAVGHVTATVAHELRNPLGTIRASLFSLRSKAPGKTEGAAKIFQRIERNVVRCDRIISELLDYSGSRAPQLETVDLNQCIARWVDDYETSESASLHLAISDSNATVRIDQDRLHQVIVNLLDNASQAQDEHPGRGRRHTKVGVRTRVEDGRFILDVADDGPGIPDDVLPRIFEPLFSTKGFGVGLGLPLVKKIIDQHGGDIEVMTGVGDGTTFRIRLPLAESREAAA